MESNKKFQNNDTDEYIDFPDANRIVVAGDLIYDPPLRWTKRGVPVTNFVICTQPDPEIDEPEELRSRRCYVSVVVWAQKAVFCSENLKKGSSIMIIGELQSMPNFAPEKAFYPVQVNAKWIQVLEKTKYWQAETVNVLQDSSDGGSTQAAVVEEETQQIQMDPPQTELEGDEALEKKSNNDVQTVQ